MKNTSDTFVSSPRLGRVSLHDYFTHRIEWFPMSTDEEQASVLALWHRITRDWDGTDGTFSVREFCRDASSYDDAESFLADCDDDGTPPDDTIPPVPSPCIPADCSVALADTVEITPTTALENAMLTNESAQSISLDNTDNVDYAALLAYANPPATVIVPPLPVLALRSEWDRMLDYARTGHCEGVNRPSRLVCGQCGAFPVQGTSCPFCGNVYCVNADGTESRECVANAGKSRCDDYPMSSLPARLEMALRALRYAEYWLADVDGWRGDNEYFTSIRRPLILTQNNLVCMLEKLPDWAVMPSVNPPMNREEGERLDAIRAMQHKAATARQEASKSETTNPPIPPVKTAQTSVQSEEKPVVKYTPVASLGSSAKTVPAPNGHVKSMPGGADTAVPAARDIVPPVRTPVASGRIDSEGWEMIRPGVLIRRNGDGRYALKYNGHMDIGLFRSREAAIAHADSKSGITPVAPVAPVQKTDKVKESAPVAPVKASEPVKSNKGSTDDEVRAEAKSLKIRKWHLKRIDRLIVEIEEAKNVVVSPVATDDDNDEDETDNTPVKASNSTIPSQIEMMQWGTSDILAMGEKCGLSADAMPTTGKAYKSKLVSIVRKAMANPVQPVKASKSKSKSSKSDKGETKGKVSPFFVDGGSPMTPSQLSVFLIEGRKDTLFTLNGKGIAVKVKNETAREWMKSFMAK